MFNVFAKDKEFFPKMWRLTVPIAMQQLVMVALGMVDVVMIGQLGDASVAAVGLANQMFFLLFLMLFGVTSGAAIFTAQYWGQKDVPRIQSVLGVSLVLSVLGSFIFAIFTMTMPESILGIYSADPDVVTLGSGYLRIVSFSYVAVAISVSYSAALRSTEHVRLPLLASIAALSLNTALNYGLIFGRLGLPQMGVNGAALATIIARSLETVILLVGVYAGRLPAAASLPALLNFRRLSLRRFFKVTMPVVLTEVLWSLGITTYHVVYARISTESVAAVNIAISIDRVLFVVFIGMAHAAAIMIGNQIGAGAPGKAMDNARRFMVLGPALAAILGLLVITIINPVLGLYHVSAETTGYARYVMVIMALTLPIRVSNLLLLIGMLRSGGDTNYAFIIDAGVIWSIGVPLAFFGAFVLHWPVHWVYLLAMIEEVVKLGLSAQRVFSKKWINHLAVPA